MDDVRMMMEIGNLALSESEEDRVQAIARIVGAMPGITDEGIEFVWERCISLVIEAANVRLFLSGRMTAAWSDEKQDWVLAAVGA